MTILRCMFHPSGLTLETPNPPAEGDLVSLPDGVHRVLTRHWAYPGLGGTGPDGTLLTITVEPAGDEEAEP